MEASVQAAMQLFFAVDVVISAEPGLLAQCLMSPFTAG